MFTLKLKIQCTPQPCGKDNCSKSSRLIYPLISFPSIKHLMFRGALGNSGILQFATVVVETALGQVAFENLHPWKLFY